MSLSLISKVGNLAVVDSSEMMRDIIIQVANQLLYYLLEIECAYRQQDWKTLA